MNDPLPLFNGVDGNTGAYYFASETKPDRRTVRECLAWYDRMPMPRVPLRLNPGLTSDLSSCGWGVIFARNTNPAIMDALTPLIKLRQSQSGHLFKKFLGATAYQQGESVQGFLKTRGIPSGPVNPQHLPYYLMLVGGPDEIPFGFQLELKKRHAVGRVAFTAVDDFARYAKTVVEVETEGISRSPHLVVFGVSHPADPIAELSSHSLTRYLSRESASFLAARGFDWRVGSLLGSRATKEQLRQTLETAESPTLLFTSCHSTLFPAGDTRCPSRQGALLCHEWRGPLRGPGRIPNSHYFSAVDVGDDTNLRGSIIFNTASFSLGTPDEEVFVLPWDRRRRQRATPSLAPLPQRFLSHPKGGALAVIGQIDRALASSFEGVAGQLQARIFEEVIRNLIAGLPIGEAMKEFDVGYAALASEASRGVRSYDSDPEAHDWIRLSLLMAEMNAHTYVVLGDPAVRRAVSSASIPL